MTDPTTSTFTIRFVPELLQPPDGQFWVQTDPIANTWAGPFSTNFGASAVNAKGASPGTGSPLRATLRHYVQPTGAPVRTLVYGGSYNQGIFTFNNTAYPQSVSGKLTTNPGD